MSKEDRWVHTAVMGGFAVAAMVLAFHTRMAWLYFRPEVSDLKGILPRLGPFFGSEWARQGLRFAGALLFFSSLPGLGGLCLPRGRRDLFSSIGVALILWSTIGLLLAAAGLSRPELLRPLSLLLVIAGLAVGFVKAPRRGQTAFAAPWKNILPSPLLAAGVAFFAAFYLLTSLVPETFYDALVYHLAAPQAWLQAGKMTDMPDLHLWRLPGFLQPLYLWALAWSDDRLCKLLNLGFGFLMAGLMGRWAGKRWGREAGGWAALLFLSAPMIGVNLWCCANDIPAGFFTFLALTLALEAQERHDAPSFFLAGLFFGAGTATKTTTLFAAPFFALLLASKLRRPGKNRRTGLTASLLFAAGFLLPLAPWWIRAGLWTGNPFYPQAAGFFGGDSSANLALIKTWNADAAGEGNLLFRSLGLVRESLRGMETGRFGFVGPALLMLLPLAFFLREDPVHALLAGYALATYVAFISTTGRLRYYIPHLPVLFVLAGACLTDYVRGVSTLSQKLFARFGPALRWIAGGAVALNLFWMAMAFQRFNQGWEVVWGRQSPGQYLLAEHIGVYGNPSQGAFDWLRENGAQGRLFIVGEARTFRSPIPARAAGNFNVPAYVPLAGDPPSADALLGRLREEGFTHLLINVEEMKRITPEAYRGEPYLRALGTVFDRLAPPLYRDGGCILFAVSPGTSGATSPTAAPAPSAGPRTRK